MSRSRIVHIREASAERTFCGRCTGTLDTAWRYERVCRVCLRHLSFGEWVFFQDGQPRLQSVFINTSSASNSVFISLMNPPNHPPWERVA